jgi:hypothetical protein
MSAMAVVPFSHLPNTPANYFWTPVAGSADGGQVAAVSRLKSSGESAWNARRRPSTSPISLACRA